MKNPPAYQYYAADFEMDTASWDVIEVGIYQRLLNYEWVNGALPDDIQGLAKIARVNPRRMLPFWSKTIQFKFHQNGKGQLVNRRMEEERLKLIKYIESQRESGKRGADKRWKKDGEPNGDPISEPNSQPNRVAHTNPNGETMALQSSSSIKDKEREDKQKPFVFCSVILKNNTSFDITEEKVKEYEITYPYLNVRQELMLLKQWNIDNPIKRKTKRYFFKHVNTWLSDPKKVKGYIASAPKPVDWTGAGEKGIDPRIKGLVKGVVKEVKG